MSICHLLFSILTLMAIPISSFAEGDADTSLIRQWIDTAWDTRYDDPSKSLALARKAVEASHPDYYFGTMNGLQLIGESYFNTGKLDSAIFYYQQALHHSRKEKDPEENGNNYTGLATIFMEAGKRDSSLHYYQLAVNTFESTKDSSALCDVLLRRGNLYNVMGHHDLAISSYMHSIRICEAIKRTEYIAYNYGSIGSVHDKQGNYAKAEEYFLKSLDIFRQLNDGYGQMGIYNNLGILYKNMKAYDKSLDAYRQSLLFADSVKFERGKLSAHTNLGILNVLMGFHENALQHSSLGLKLSLELQVKESTADNLNWMARAQMGLHDLENALLNALQSLVIATEVKSLEKQRDANLTLSEIYEARHDFVQSLEHYKTYSLVRDSLMNTEKTKQITEIQTRYETEKKDNQIELLAKKAELDKARKTRLWIGLGLSMLAGALLVHSQWVRRVRDRKILSQEKELETERRKISEFEKEGMSRELDLKKQELAAKALLLARKNGFLQTLHEEVDNLRQLTEGTASDAARKISQHIRMDMESDNEWDQFLTSFREVHRDFMESLHRAYPDMTKNELKLACLMKMNLTAKEQAALLNVTQDGIKKARYRLRKTMQLDSDVDIQEFLLAFPVA